MKFKNNDRQCLLKILMLQYQREEIKNDPDLSREKIEEFIKRMSQSISDYEDTMKMQQAEILNKD